MSADFPEYHKINGVFKRHTSGPNKGKFIMGDWAQPEFSCLRNAEWTWTEKIDGTNIRVRLQHGIGLYEDHDEHAVAVTLGGRTANAQIPAPLVAHLNSTFTEDLVREKWPSGCDIVLYGEGFGAGIQKGGGNYGPDQRFILFDVWCDSWWLKREDVEGIAGSLGIPVVKQFWANESLFNMISAARRTESGDKWLSAFDGLSAEGYVGTPSVPLFDRRGNRIITKVKKVDFDNDLPELL